MKLKSIVLTLVAIFFGIGVANSQPQSIRKSYNFSRGLEEAQKGNNADAMDFFNKELKDNPNNGYAYMSIAVLQMDANDYNLAQTNIEQAIRKLPKKDKEWLARAFATRAHLYSIAGDTIKAIGDFDQAIKVNPKDDDLYEHYAQLLYELKRYDEGTRLYHEIVSLNPNSVMGYMGLGRNAYATGNYEEAIRQYNKVISMYDDYSSGYAFRAESYLKQGKYLEAADDIMKALSIDSDAKAHHYLFEFPLNQTALVVTKLKGMAVKDPYNAEWYYYIGQVYNDKKMYREAINALKQAYDIDAHPVFLELIADSHQSLGEFSEALEAITQAQQMRPDEIEYIQIKGDILGESGDVDGAIAEWSRYIEKSPDFFYGYYRRGFFKDNADRTDDALEDYNMAVMLNPNYAYAHLGQADMLMRKGETKKAIAAYKIVTELDTVPDNSSCAMYAFLALGEKDKAIDFMNRVIEQDSTDCGNYYDGACFYSRLGDLDKALSNLRRSLELGFRRFHHVMSDDDLEALRATEGFKALMQEYQSKREYHPDADADNAADGMAGLDYEIVKIPFTPDNGCASVKCTVNDLPLSFIFDTGASTVSLSMVEANFMLKNGYLKKDDFVGFGRFVDANGDVSDGAIINLRNVDFGGLHLNNVRASVVRNQKAPLLLGQTVLGRLGSVEIDNPNKQLIIKR